MIAIASFILLVFATGRPQEGSEEARRLIEQLRSDDSAVREEATQKLKALGKAAVPELQKAAKGSDKEVARRARIVIRVIELRETLTPNLMEVMKGVEDRLATGNDHTWTEVFLEAVEEEAGKRRYPSITREDLEVLIAPALRGAWPMFDGKRLHVSLQKFRLRSAVPEIMKGLTNKLPLIRSGTMELLMSLGRKEAAAAIIPLLEDSAKSVRQKAAEAVGRLHAVQAVPGLIALLGDESPGVRGSAARALATLDAQEAIPELLKLTGDEDSAVRGEAARSLGTLGAREAVDELVALLNDEVAEVRWKAAVALGRMGDRQVIGELMNLLEDPASTVRAMAVHSLAALDAREAVESLVDRRGGGKDISLSRLSGALARVGSKASVPKIILLLKSEDVAVRRDAIGVLLVMGAQEAVPEIVKLLKDKDQDTRRVAVIALGYLGATESVPEIMEFLDDRTPFMRSTAVGALENLGARKALPKITELLEDGDRTTRLAVVQAIGTLGTKQSARELIPLFNDHDSRIRFYAIKSVGKLGAKEAGPELERLISDRSADVRHYAATALCRLGLRKGIPEMLEVPTPYMWGHLFALNAVRQPGVWKRMQAKGIMPKNDASLIERIERVAGEAGIAFEPPERPTAAQSFALGSRESWPIRSLVETPLLELLEKLMTHTAALRDFEVILEPDRMRILPREEALAFWKAWWAEEQKKR